MDIRQLEYYIMVYEAGSFLRAAENSFISQQGISNSVAMLEEEIGAKLFQRTRRGLIPTASGETLYQFALACTGGWNNYKAKIRGDRLEHSLRIGFDIGFMELIPLSIFSEFYLIHPEEKIYIKNYVDECKISLLKGEIDLGFCSLPVDPELFDTLVESSRKVRLAVSKENPLARRSSIRVSDLRDENLIDIALNTPAQLYYRNICKLNRVEPNILLNASQGKIIEELVSKNAAVSFFAGEDTWLPDSVVLLPFEDIDVSYGFQLLVRKNVVHTDLMTDFVRLLKQKLNAE